MEKKMNSGEIEKKAGLSQKAVRLYDEKGLLKPSDYSEGNYRLYDKASLQILEKIVALKQIGFSLEEIRDNLVAGEASDVEEALRMQLKVMEEKKYCIEKVIAAINRTFDRKSGSLDWDDVAEIVRNVSLDQKADERHWDALKHTSQEEDWYVKIFKSLPIPGKEKILDLGCGFAKLWRNNWSDIPKDTKIFGYDLHGSWADNFAEFLEENKKDLPGGVEISLEFDDLEQDSSWKKIKKNKDYDLIIAHYLCLQLKNPEELVKRAAGVLAKGGVFSYNGESLNRRHPVFRDDMKAAGIKAPFIDEKIKEGEAAQAATEAMLLKYFGKAEPVILTNIWHYTDAEEIFIKMSELYPDQQKFLSENKKKILKYYSDRIEKDGEVTLEIGSLFWHCTK